MAPVLIILYSMAYFLKILKQIGGVLIVAKNYFVNYVVGESEGITD